MHKSPNCYVALVIASLDPMSFLPIINPWEVRKMAKKQTGNTVSSLAGKILSGSKPATQSDAKKLAASVLSQDEKKGKKP
jgi:hypothetical protein